MKKVLAALQTNLGASVVGGLVVALVIWAAPKAVDNIPVQAFVVVAGVALALGVVAFSVANGKWRARTWGWLAGLRITTAKNRQGALERASLHGYGDGCESMVPEINRLNALVEDTRRERDEFKSSLTDVLAAPQSTDEQIRTVPQLPPLAPRWTIVTQLIDGDEYGPRYRRWKLVNMVADSVAYNVRVEASPAARFSHTDGAAWRDMSGRAERNFGGEVTETGALKGFHLTVWWIDSAPEQNYFSKEFWIPPTERAEAWGESTPF